MVAVDKQALNAAVQILVKAYNNPTQRAVENAITTLRGSIASPSNGRRAVRADQAKITREPFIPFGVKWLDDWLRGGARLGEFFLWVDVPGGSKTHMLKWFGRQMLLQDSEVLDISGEDLIGDTLGYYQTRMPKDAIKKLWLTDMDGAFGTEDVADIIENHRKEHGAECELKMVIVDHLDLMTPPYANSEASALKKLSTEMKFLAKHEKVMLVSASQALFLIPGGPKGLARIYGSKVGKAGNMDVIFVVDNSDGENYTVTLAKARGRKKQQENQKVLQADWDKMEVQE